MPIPFKVQGMPLIGGLPAKVLVREPIFVDSNNGSNDNSGLRPQQPLATISNAFSASKVGANGLILVAPGHSETITAAGGIDTSNASGVHVLGLGEGTARPTINFTTATGADINIDTANITLENLYFDLTGIDALTGPIDVNAAHLTIKECHFLISDSGGQCVDLVVATAAADYMRIEGCLFEGSSDAGPQSAVQLTGCDAAMIVNNRFYGNFGVSPIEVVTTAATRLHIEYNDMENFNANDVGITLITSSTGTIRWNTIRVATDGQVTYINGTNSCQLFENYGVNNDGETGQLEGSVSS
jgi:hypothetical protein